MLTLALLLGCPEPEPACGPAAELTWANTGRPFLDTWCTSCHGAEVPEQERQGAPVGSDFDSWHRARAHAGAIEAWATGPAPAMPPAGGPTDEERERFARWLACGEPVGTELPASTCGPAFVGDATSADDLCGQGYGSVVGDLTLSSPVELPCLCSVEGDVTITGVEAGEVHLPALTEVGGELRIGTNPGLTRVVTSIESAASVHVADNSLLEVFRAPRLARAGSLLRIAHNPALHEASVGGALQQVASIEIAHDGSLRELGSFDALTSLPGALVLDDLPELPDCHGFFSLTSVGELTLRGVGSTQLHCFSALERVHGDLFVLDNPSLQRVPGLVALHQVDGDLSIRGNPALGMDELTELLEQVQVQGTTDVGANGP